MADYRKVGSYIIYFVIGSYLALTLPYLASHPEDFMQGHALALYVGHWMILAILVYALFNLATDLDYYWYKRDLKARSFSKNVTKE